MIGSDNISEYTGKKMRVAFDYIVDYINQNDLKQDERLPTEKELIEATGVSRVTLRRALANLQKDGMVYSIQGSGYYVGKAVAKNNKINVTPFVASYGHSASRVLEVIQGAQNYLHNTHCRLDVVISGKDPVKERQIIQQYYDEGIRCIIVLCVSSEDNEGFYFEMMKAGMEFIFIDRKPSNLYSCNLVQPDNLMGGYMATNHLIQQGHKHIATFSLEPIHHTSSIIERINGYKMALGESNIALPDKFYYSLTDTADLQEVDELLDKDSGFTAIFSMNDNAAIELVQHAYRRGIQIPGDIAIIGFDNLGITSTSTPPISTIEQPFMDIGYSAAKMAYSFISNGNVGFVNRILPVSLIVRESTTNNSIAFNTSAELSP